jgi:hypothetical protein
MLKLPGNSGLAALPFLQNGYHRKYLQQIADVIEV